MNRKYLEEQLFQMQKKIGYKHICLDTLPFMNSVILDILSVWIL
jgi:hypothetical protein